MRKDFDEVLKKNTDILYDDAKYTTLLHIGSIKEIEAKDAIPLEGWEFPKDYLGYMEQTVENFKVYWSKRQTVHDDFLPKLNPYYGIAEHSAFVGGNVVYGGNTSYHEHPMTDWAMLDDLHCDENNENFVMLLDSMRYIKERSKSEGFIAALRGVDGPLDIANAIRGNDLMLDFYLYPENVHKLCKFCVDAGKWTIEHQMEIVGMQYGGYMNAFGVWMPGKSIGQVSEDLTSMCSLDTYMEFGKKYTQELINDYDLAMLHVHTLGKHILPEISSLDKADIIQIEYDPSQPPPVEVYKECIDVLKDKVVALNTNAEEIKNNIEFLRSHKNILRIECETLKEAEDISDFINESY